MSLARKFLNDILAAVGGAQAKDGFIESEIHATDFGVIADGVTDDTVALQAALDSVPESGGIVVLPPGEIICSQTLYVRRYYTTLRGVGPGTRSERFDPPGIGLSSKLIFTAAVDGIRISPPENAAATQRMGGITLRDFGIAGTSVNNGKSGIRCEKLDGNPALYGPTDDCLIERVSVTRYELGFRIVNNDITKISQCWPTECGAGIYMQGGFYFQITNSCIADNYVAHGIELVDVLGGSIVGNIIVRNKQDAIKFSGSTRDVCISANIIRNDTANGAIVGFGFLLRLMAGVVRCSISGNTFSALSGSGFSIADSAVGNVFSGNQHDNFSPAYGAGKNFVDGWESVWTAATFENGWSNFGNCLEAVSFRRSRTGRVQIQGVATGGAVGTLIAAFTLPAGYRPNAIQLFSTITNDGVIDIHSRLVVQTSGLVGIETGGNDFAVFNCEFSTPSFTF